MASTDELLCVIVELIRIRMDRGRDAVSITEIAAVAQGMVMGESQQSLEKKIREIASAPDSAIDIRDDTVFISEPCVRPDERLILWPG